MLPQLYLIVSFGSFSPSISKVPNLLSVCFRKEILQIEKKHISNFVLYQKIF